MSIFSFPRINVKGLIAINVGTANNDDYSNVVFPPGWGAYEGLPMRLADSNNVQPLTYGMDDATFIEWIQAVQPFLQPQPAAAMTKAGTASPTAAATQNLIPAEWNYYGDMGLTMQNVNVLGVITGEGGASDPAAAFLTGAQLSFNNAPGSSGYSTGMIIDVNPESVPCSQIFADNLLLQQNGAALISGKPSKGVTRWINFQRNVNLTASGGASGYFQCVIPIAAVTDQRLLAMLPATDSAGRALAGIVFRYNLYRTLPPINSYRYPGSAMNDALIALYKTQGTNAAIAEIGGTLAPWYDGEMRSVPTGRMLMPTQNTIPIPPQYQGNGPQFRLAPAIFQVDAERGVLSIDFSATFPDVYTSTDYDPTVIGSNPKYDFGPVTLQARMGTEVVDLGTVNYQDTDAGDRAGWIFDIPLTSLQTGYEAVVAQGDLFLTSAQYGDLMAESNFAIASDQSCIFGEQSPVGASERMFMNDGAEEPAIIKMFYKGVELAAHDCPAITVWEYDATPNQSPGPLVPAAIDFKPGQWLQVRMERSGNRLYTFTVEGQAPPPANFNNLDLMTVPMINLRILPNNKGYDQYYVDPTAPEPIGNDSLTFEVIYREVLRNYYLLYPAMSKVVALNDPAAWDTPAMATHMLARTSKAVWAQMKYMPRTRDLSDSRRTLLEAWCRKSLKGEV